MTDYIEARIPLDVVQACVTGLNALARFTDDAVQKHLCRQASDELYAAWSAAREKNRYEQEEQDKDMALESVAPRQAGQTGNLGKGF